MHEFKRAELHLAKVKSSFANFLKWWRQGGRRWLKFSAAAQVHHQNEISLNLRPEGFLKNKISSRRRKMDYASHAIKNKYYYPIKRTNGRPR